MWWKFIQAVRRGEYKLSTTTWITAIGAVLYTLTPVDFIPEIMLGPFGLIDDIGFWAFAFTLVNREKTAWETQLRDHDYVDVTPRTP
ncbi:YkvA family protein [Demequina sp.]|uniref:YkvA family protein n=1 Tax=Demequina sp. TaxID=2050685 RepID=UPI003A85AB8F